ncbi:hypothetical protein [Streptomyces sp. NPDC005012]|uniref:hypothetical protein n=1 Tax=Streptomyces sp. NPDC005012 TaxID=3154558 RepID=UPI0033A60E70
MAIPRARKLIITVAVASVCAFTLGAYLLGVSPFKKVGTIGEAAVCETLGPAPEAVKTLRSVLPEEASYRFSDDTQPRASARETWYTANCLVEGEDRTLLSVSTTLQPADPPEVWLEDHVLEEVDNEGNPTPFAAGEKAVASDVVAAVYVPCTPQGVAPGGQYNLGVVVHLEEPGGSDESRTRKGLIALAKSSALHAHRDAKCTMPSGVDR